MKVIKRKGPTSKQQRSFKQQTDKSAKARRLPFKYLLVTERASFVNETPDGKEGSRHPFDLEERTAQFGEAIVRFSKKIPRDPTNNRLIDQLVGSGTGIGANYCEANEGVSKKDFRNIISRRVKESKEAKFFLRMVAASEAQLADEARQHYREAKELHLIFASIFRKTKGQG
ncbi:MAG TPA: four helix bundle protein [Candidatus Udaeobacter sp.]|nr:four helix bundle protein [Candidatus Udaeobacter sp.]